MWLFKADHITVKCLLEQLSFYFFPQNSNVNLTQRTKAEVFLSDIFLWKMSFPWMSKSFQNCRWKRLSMHHSTCWSALKTLVHKCPPRLHLYCFHPGSSGCEWLQSAASLEGWTLQHCTGEPWELHSMRVKLQLCALCNSPLICSVSGTL